MLLKLAGVVQRAIECGHTAPSAVMVKKLGTCARGRLFGWSDFATARLEELKQKHGVSDRKDIMTIADAIDLDEKRKS